jgi:hypothetical protein
LARKPRVSSADKQQALSVAELEALAERLPVTGVDGGPPEGGPPVDLQIEIRDEARDLLERAQATPGEADRMWARLPSYWRRQFCPRGVAAQLPSVHRLRAIDAPYLARIMYGIGVLG